MTPSGSCSCSYAPSTASQPRAPARPLRSTSSAPCSHTSVEHLSARSTRRGPQPCRSATDPVGLQDVLVGGAVVSAISAALISGLKKDPVPCDLCQGLGGVKCFGCAGDGKMPTLIKKEDLEKPVKRDPLGRSRNPRECRVCNGAGLTFCSRCKGSGYVG